MRITYRPLVAMAGVAILAACGGGSSTSSATGAASDTAAASASASASESASAPAPSSSSSALPQRGDADLVVWTDQLKAPAVQKAAEKFAADNGIKVAVQVIATDLQANLVTANAAGNGPDVFTGAHDWIGNLVQNGSIEPLQISADKLSGYEDVAIKAETYNGKLYALPYGIEALAFYRNTDDLAGRAQDHGRRPRRRRGRGQGRQGDLGPEPAGRARTATPTTCSRS